MIAKFEEDPPLSSKAPADGQNPDDLLNFVTSLQISDGDSPNPTVWWLIINRMQFKLSVCFRWKQTSR